jgi:hypothetical protein
MNSEDLTVENLQTLVDISNSFNIFYPGYLTLEGATQETPENTYLTILWFSNFEFYSLQEYKKLALEFIYTKELLEMPLFLNDDMNFNLLLKSRNTFVNYNWIPIVAQWRLRIGC